MCGLTVEGNPTSVKKMKKQLNTKFTKVHDEWNMKTQNMEQVKYTYSKPIFAFHNIFNHIQDGVPSEIYNAQKDHNENPAKLFSGNNWYDWNVRNWGTKWDVAVSNDDKYPDTELVEEGKNGENYVVAYRFNTAWSPAVPAIQKLSKQYPDLLFTFNYEEETGWGGEIEILKGKIISESEYDWQCRECGNTEDETPYCETCEYDMCPKCGYGEADEDLQRKCPTHKVKLEELDKLLEGISK